MGLSSILALILTPGPCARAALQLCPHLPGVLPILDTVCAQSCLSTTAQPGSHRAGSDPGHHRQLTLSRSCGTWPTGYSLCPGLFPCHPWLPSPSRAVFPCFQVAFSLTISCTYHKKLKYPVHTLILQAIHCITAKHNLLNIFRNYADKPHTKAEVQTYRFTLFMLPWNNSFILSSTLFRSCKK